MSTSCSIVVILRYSINIVYLDNLSIMTKIILSFFLIRGSFNKGNLVIKSIIMIYCFLFKALFS